jgi:hypothetical protein
MASCSSLADRGTWPHHLTARSLAVSTTSTAECEGQHVRMRFSVHTALKGQGSQARATFAADCYYGLTLKRRMRSIGKGKHRGSTRCRPRPISMTSSPSASRPQFWLEVIALSTDGNSYARGRQMRAATFDTGPGLPNADVVFRKRIRRRGKSCELRRTGNYPARCRYG